MADLVKRNKAYAAIGLQARSAPASQLCARPRRSGLCRRGAVHHAHRYGLNWGPFMDAPNAYTADRKNGATLLTIPLGHSVDALCYALGEVTDVIAEAAVRRATCTSVETGAAIPMTTPTDRRRRAAQGGRGDRGPLSRRNAARHRPSLGDQRNEGRSAVDRLWRPRAVVRSIVERRDGRGQGIAAARDPPSSIDGFHRCRPRPITSPRRMFALPRTCATERRTTCPGFEEALVRHRMTDAIQKSADTGKRVHID